MIKLFTMVFYHHSTVITKVMQLYDTEWQYFHGMAVNYSNKKFYNTGPGSLSDKERMIYRADTLVAWNLILPEVSSSRLVPGLGRLSDWGAEPVGIWPCSHVGVRVWRFQPQPHVFFRLRRRFCGAWLKFGETFFIRHRRGERNKLECFPKQEFFYSDRVSFHKSS